MAEHLVKIGLFSLVYSVLHLSSKCWLSTCSRGATNAEKKWTEITVL